MVLHEFGHQAVDGAARGGEALEDIRAGIIFIQSAQNTFELPDDFLGAVDEVQFLARSVRHFSCLPSGGMVSTSKPFDKGLMNSRTEG